MSETRRSFLGRAMAAAAISGLTSCADERRPVARMRRVGVIYDDARPTAFDPFFARMTELGYVDGPSIAYERRTTGPGTVIERARELAAIPVDVIVTGAGAVQWREATTSIPVVVLYAPDPVEHGLVPSLARPGGNVTGLATLTTDLGVKQLEALREVIPQMKHVGVLYAPSARTGPAFAQLMRPVVLGFGLQLTLLELGRPEDLDATFRSAPRVDGLVVQDSGPTVMQLDRILALVAQYKWPTVWSRQYVVSDKGGFLSYGHDFDALMRRGAEYVDRILSGARPADLPMERGSKFELAVNLKTARELGVAVPQSILGRATRVIQ